MIRHSLTIYHVSSSDSQHLFCEVCPNIIFLTNDGYRRFLRLPH